MAHTSLLPPGTHIPHSISYIPYPISHIPSEANEISKVTESLLSVWYTVTANRTTPPVHSASMGHQRDLFKGCKIASGCCSGSGVGYEGYQGYQEHGIRIPEGG